MLDQRLKTRIENFISRLEREDVWSGRHRALYVPAGSPQGSAVDHGRWRRADSRLDPVGVQRIYDAFFEEVYPDVDMEDMAFKIRYGIHDMDAGDAAGYADPEGGATRF